MKVSEIKELLGIPVEADCYKCIITPEQAKTLLEECNTKNRGISNSNVMKLARSLRNGEWKLTNDCVSFDNEGIMTNAQHRCTASVKTGLPIEVFVSFGVERSTAIDTGKKRSFSDNVKINDGCDERIREDTVIHGLFKTAVMCQDGSYNRASTLTDDKLVDLMNKYADDLVACRDAGLFKKVTFNGCNNVIVKSALFMAYMNDVDLSLLSHLVDVLDSGIITKEEDIPIIGLRDKLTTIRGTGADVTSYRYGLVQGCIKRLVNGSKAKSTTCTIEYTYKFY